MKEMKEEKHGVDSRKSELNEEPEKLTAIVLGFNRERETINKKQRTMQSNGTRCLWIAIQTEELISGRIWKYNLC
jgi:peptidoglycan hydrolase CwlO-like protein